MKKPTKVVHITPRPLETIPVYRLHLPDYNEAAWEIEGKDLYPQFENYEHYRRAFESISETTK
ncbi:hypothetical protein LCGC14_0921940 [marine sediment metagenome]|uniref:Uncharacterized protein n=1 Tax=marine sediment metagenome TaxID=412755 RepID=A0A0F9RX87_9ZZZZ